LPTLDILDILKNRGTPLINSDGVTAYDDSVEYVAFSHVWSDGLGSNTESSLPECSVNWLCNLAVRCKSEGICKSDLFWIDSLCIPKSKDLRKTAIAKMADIYSKVSTTIVIDQSLSRLGVHEVETETILVRIATSPWSRRMWTLQEGILSKNLHFLVNDGFISAMQIMERAMFDSLLTPISVQCGLELFDLVKARRQPGYSVGRLINQLRYRTTSRSGDKLGCLGAIMELDVDRLLEFDGQERALQFWKMVGTVPADIVVTPGERLTQEGFRWAP
jgi:hypothetical protein